MKKELKKLLGLTLTASLLFGMAGCGSSNVSNQESSENTEPGTEVSTEVTEPIIEEITYPLDTDATISLWSNAFPLNSDYSEPSQSPFHSGLAKNTGVDIDWRFPVDTNVTTAYNTLMADSELPDIIFKGTWTMNEVETLMDEGVIWDLTEYIPIYAPDYWAAINQPQYQDVLHAITTTDGKQFCIASWVEGDFNICYQGPMVRLDWLEECGLDMPVTLEDWEEMLTVFKEKYGARYAFAKTYFSTTSSTATLGLNSGTGAYSSFAANWFLDDNGKVQFAQTQPEWKEYITIMNRWWENDLIDKDSVTMNAADVRTKAANNLVSASHGAFSQLTNFVKDAEKTGAVWSGVENPRVAEGVPTCAINMAYDEWTSQYGAVITNNVKTEEDLITVLKFLNYGFTEEGIKYYAYGTEGVSYTLNSEGEAEYTELLLNDPQGLTGAAKKYTGTMTRPISIQQTHAAKLKNSEVAVEAGYMWIENTVAAQHCVPASMSYTEEENLAYTNAYSAIKTYVSEMSLKFLTGEIDIETEYDNFVATLKEMGLDKCQEIQQAAYDRYISK